MWEVGEFKNSFDPNISLHMLIKINITRQKNDFYLARCKWVRK